MKFSVDWIDGARNANAEERATLCDLQIFVGDANACRFYDAAERRAFDHIVVPAVHLAEGIATDWWAIFGGRDRPRSVLPYRTGFALPNLLFQCDGADFTASAYAHTYENPPVDFSQAGPELMPRADAENTLAAFIRQVVDRLADSGVRNSEVALCWQRIARSLQDPDEMAFCVAAGGLGLDPYSISDTDAHFIEVSGSWFAGEELIEFLAGAAPDNHDVRTSTIQSIARVESKLSDKFRLPELDDAARQISDATQRHPGERAWAPGYRAAQALRAAAGIQNNATLPSFDVIARKFGGGSFRTSGTLSGVTALVSRNDDDLRIYLPDREAETFAFARAIGAAVCFPSAPRSVVNRLWGAEQQATGRAFAAEFLAPVNQVLDLHHSGYNDGEIADHFKVFTQVIEHQLENQERIRQACAVA